MQLTRSYDEIEGLDAEVVAISTDDLSKATLIADQVGVAFPVLYDPSAQVVRRYGVYNLLGDGLATASTFVIDRDGLIRWKYVSRTIGDRPSTAEVLRQLRSIEG